MGLSKLIDWLHAAGHLHRGTPFHVSTLQAILRREAYGGRLRYNRLCVKSGETRPSDDRVCPVPPIVDEARFAAAQSQLTQRRRNVTAPRLVNGPTLLSAIARCGQAGCDRHLIKLTGKGGRYAYHGCAGRANRATATCGGMQIRMDELDDVVLTALEEQVLDPERLQLLLAESLDITAVGVERKKENLALFRGERTRIEKAIAGLYELVEAGLDGPANRSFGDRLSGHQRRLTALDVDIANLERQIEGQRRRVTPGIVAQAAALIRSRLRTGGPAFRRAYVQLLIDQVVLTPTEIRISGQKVALEGTVTLLPTDRPPRTPSFDREWCRLQDSNL